MRRVKNGWVWLRNVSIVKKLHFIVWLMAILIAGELAALHFAMRQLSAARAFVGGESLWSKAQKDAVFSLQRYALTREEKDYQDFLYHLRIPDGDRQARLELLKSEPDVEIVRQGFAQGRIHEDDIGPVIDLLRNFYWISYLKQAINIWERGDELILQLKDEGLKFRNSLNDDDLATAQAALKKIKNLNSELTVLEEDFSYTLGEGSRWLEALVLSILIFAVLTVESVGLSLAFFISRSLSTGLTELSDAAHAIGQGDLSRTVAIRSRDEIGRLGEAVNTMGQLLKQSYSSLESRVQERTLELARLASENARLYDQAQIALDARDEFISIASHELQSPITSLSIQLQTLAGEAQSPTFNREKIALLAKTCAGSIYRLDELLGRLLDLTRIRAGKFEVSRHECDLVPIAQAAIAQFGPEAARRGSAISFESDKAVLGIFDPVRISQVFGNLVSNAIKYGNGRPVAVEVRRSEEGVVLRVIDGGKGMTPEVRAKIFHRFERGDADPGVTGLGLGLYITHKIVKAHGGRISVESAVNQGTAVTVFIPNSDHS